MCGKDKSRNESYGKGHSHESKITSENSGHNKELIMYPWNCYGPKVTEKMFGQGT